MTLRKNLIFILTNPIIDIVKPVPESFLEKYDLSPNSACVYSKNQEGIFEELETLSSQYLPGGSTLNTARIIQWLLKLPNTVTIFGAVGKDQNALHLKNTLKNENLNCTFKDVEGVHSGRCAVLITKEERCLCTDLGASKVVNENDLKTKSIRLAVEQAQYYYVSGFFFGASASVVHELAEYGNKNEKTFVLNVGATFLTQNFKLEFQKVLPYVDIVICNEEEIFALQKCLLNKTTSTVFEAVNDVKNYQFLKKDKQRTVVVTRGSTSVIFSTENDSYVEVPVQKIENIKDTNAAGDAFAGGFLAQYVKGKAIKDCVKCGIWTAAHIVQNVGCSFNKNLAYDD